jgi:hypothetical protein
MRVTAALALALSPGLAWAQNDQSVIVIPPAPPVVAAPPAASSPPAAPVPPPVTSQTLPAVPPGAGSVAAPEQGQGAPAQAQAQPTPPDVAPTPPNDWVPGHTAIIGVLNEVDGSTAEITLPVGGPPVKTGDVLVSAQACATRPPQELPDTAVFLTVQPAGDSNAAPLYRGWMLRSAPGATVVGNAAESFRVIRCQ